MDVQQLVEVLQGTIHPDTRESAEKRLEEVRKCDVIIFRSWSFLHGAKTWRMIACSDVHVYSI